MTLTNREVIEKNGGDIVHMAFQLAMNMGPDFDELVRAFCEGDCLKASKYIDFNTLHTLNKCFGYLLRRDQVLELSLTIKDKREVS